jgi:hypothetical protein
MTTVIGSDLLTHSTDQRPAAAIFAHSDRT